ncbi:MAG: hypothetical protein CMP76_12245 [Flavobacterium sp.]|uniref:hypothetical protein n=1 Tax=Flavobacterium sp. TaxID=239 RepID=UPI000C6016A6|nr:hypothetical protein [Flavobacterium sp.]MBF04056.1 hypothetical protein [Flavobacterium sp.]|tara:strand:+ start:29 stop:463 length:435 start_codon:yes stop_codon:yes gene_type:complete
MNYLLLFIVGFFLFKSDKKAKHDANFDIPNPNNDTNVSNTNVANTKPTISVEKAKALSQRLFQIMGLDWFTSVSDIKSVLRDIETEANYKLVSQQFGVRAYSNTFSNSTWDILGEQLDLTEWLLREMDKEADRQYLKKMFPNIF